MDLVQGRRIFAGALVASGMFLTAIAPSAGAVNQSYNFDDCDWNMYSMSTGTGISDWAGDDCRQMRAYVKTADINTGAIYTKMSPYTTAENVEVEDYQPLRSHHKSRGRVQSWETDRWQDSGYIW